MAGSFAPDPSAMTFRSPKNARSQPAAIPDPTTRPVSRKTVHCNPPRVAPSAIRTAISRLRNATESAAAA